MATQQKNRNKSARLAIFGLGCMAVFVLATAALVRGRDIALLNPKGFIANEQYKLLLISTAIMLAFAVVVIFFIYFFAWRYRDNRREPAVDQTAGRNKPLLVTAWVSPILVFFILAALMLPATQKLAPTRAIEGSGEPLTIQVIAMRWKWLFIYPEQKIATVNFVQIPVDSPVKFELTADEAPMNSFWIPHLGGMLYAMTGHVNPLNLMADETGDYEGGAAEVNGRGLSGMRFTARVSTKSDFDAWVDEVRYSADRLDVAEYQKLLEPSEYHPDMYYSHAGPEIFETLMNKYADSHPHSSDYGEHSNSTDGGH